MIIWGREKKHMKRQNWIALAAATMGAVGIGLMAKSFLPQSFQLDELPGWLHLIDEL
jgi:hypothetical protein